MWVITYQDHPQDGKTFDNPQPALQEGYRLAEENPETRFDDWGVKRDL